MLRTVLLMSILIPSLCFGQFWTKGAEERKAKRKTAWLVSHEKLSGICAATYPVFETNGKSDTLYVPNDSLAYDRFATILDSLLTQIQQDSINLATRINAEDYTNLVYRSYADTVFKDNSYKYQKEIFELSNQVRFLKSMYKPCDSSKMIINHTIYRVDEAEIQRLKNKAIDEENLIAAKDILILDCERKIKAEDAWKLRFFILCGSILLLWGIRYLITKKIF